MSIISIPKPLREKLGDEAADSLAVLMNQIEKESSENALVRAEDRFEKKLALEISETRIELKKEISELRIEMGKNFSSAIKWMFLFWIGQIGVLTSILFAVFK